LRKGKKMSEKDDILTIEEMLEMFQNDKEQNEAKNRFSQESKLRTPLYNYLSPEEALEKYFSEEDDKHREELQWQFCNLLKKLSLEDKLTALLRQGVRSIKQCNCHYGRMYIAVDNCCPYCEAGRQRHIRESGGMTNITFEKFRIHESYRYIWTLPNMVEALPVGIQRNKARNVLSHVSAIEEGLRCKRLGGNKFLYIQDFNWIPVVFALQQLSVFKKYNIAPFMSAYEIYNLSRGDNLSYEVGEFDEYAEADIFFIRITNAFEAEVAKFLRELIYAREFKQKPIYFFSEIPVKALGYFFKDFQNKNSYARVEICEAELSNAAEPDWRADDPRILENSKKISQFANSERNGNDEFDDSTMAELLGDVDYYLGEE
jgi:hypothetical protein